MRTAFIHTLTEVAESDPDVHLLVGDLGFGVIEGFESRFPSRFANVGVAEQDLIGLAAGMAIAGATVFTYSMVNFSVMRALEQIRLDVCYHDASVKIAAVGGGLVYGSLGVTHHGTEDIAALRAIPGMRIIAPADPVEAAWATRIAAETPGPFYLRLGRNGEPHLHADASGLGLGRAATLLEGDDAALIATGSAVQVALDAAEVLRRVGIEVRVLSMHTIAPLDEEAVLAAARETRAIVTVEEHSIVGGLGGAVAEVLAERRGPGVPFRRVGLPREFVAQVGSAEYLRERLGLTPARTAAVITELLEEV